MIPTRPHLSIGAGRFAPTPTGVLHLGNMRTALLAWLAARKAGLRNILRVEDLEPASMPAGCLAGQYADLDWMGLIYDEGPRVGGPAGPYRQSERYAQYNGILDALNAQSLLYPCWCSRKEVRAAARAPHASDEGPIYAATCKPERPTQWNNLTDFPQRRDRYPALRLDVTAALNRIGGNSTLSYTDLIAGPQHFKMLTDVGDFVVRRIDHITAYQIACSWDDVAMGCTQVIRGADLITSTARQLLILRVLNLPEPAYGHAGLVLNADGTRMAKRDAAVGVSALREAGRSPAELRRLLARTSGLPDTADLDHLTEAFSVSAVSPLPVCLRVEVRDHHHIGST